ncbi:DUF1643 domain-containing protein [Levilactobacillus suantsaiihabitans]|uniref:DUF1643 domain-containing protein n=1 Tax=Levilactobacillus suantsaiihabitans TaxID=2487722 RepID=A0A4Z0J528_9LACO|nr:DUF1643 domain-containing protein [Levilactobacillus suantsaiihabitans]TGD17555.1 DUF1643 domain-containing protein [Levilactobacillus suantsaiihabitans]
MTAATDERKHLSKATIEITQKSKGEDVYWVKQVWDTSKPIVLVLANYPASHGLLEQDLTGMLIRNAALEMKTYGGVIIANLFTRSVKWPTNKSLSAAYAEDSMTELVKACKEADQVIVAIGSLPDRSEVALARVKEFWQAVTDEQMFKKILLLVNGQGKPVHPLAIRNEQWQFSAWRTDWMKTIKKGEDPVESSVS